MTLFGATYFQAGRRVTAAQLQAVATQVDSLTKPGWTSYGSWATLITATTTNPTQGSSTISAHYRRAADEDAVDFKMRLSIDTGGGFSAGSGTYRFLLPYTASTLERSAYSVAIFESGVALRVGTTGYVDTTHFEVCYDEAGSAIGSGGLSTSWTTGDWIAVSGRVRLPA